MANNGQRYVELLSLSNKDTLSSWKVLSGTKKIFDDKLKTFVLCLKGGKAPVPLLQWPNERANKSLTQPVLVFQMFLAANDNILFDIRISCNNNLKKRISLSTNQKIVRKTSLSVTLPVTILNKGTWSHLLVNIEEIVSSFWNRDSLRNVDSVCLSGNCSIKRIFTLRRDMIGSEDGRVQTIKYDQLPKQMSLSKTNTPTYDFVICLSDAEEGKSSTNSLSSQLISTSSMSGHFNVMKSTHRKPPISKSRQNYGGISQPLSLESEYLHNRSPCSASVNADHVLPLLSRLTFASEL